MKSNGYTLLLIASLVSFSSCKKWLPENRIEGSWTLTEIEKRRPLANESVSSVYKTGTFWFNEDGTAAYTDALGTLLGNWIMRDEPGSGYTDSDGNWQSNTKRVLLVKLYDFSSNRVIDWYFDRFDFRSSGNRLVAFIKTPNYTYRYSFNRK